MAQCIKKIDVTDIGQQHDLTDTVKDFTAKQAKQARQVQQGSKTKSAAGSKQDEFTEKDRQVIERIRKSKSGKEFNSLITGQYSGDSDTADIKLMTILAFFTDCDAAQMERIYKSTALYEPTKGKEYIANIKSKAIGTVSVSKKNKTIVGRALTKSTGRAK